jgi:hypothetical protein
MPLVIQAGPGSRRSAAEAVGGGSDNDGLVVSDFANYDPDDAQVISLDVNATLPSWGTHNGATMSFANETWWNGASVPVCTLRPPTLDESSSGFGQIDVWKSATKEVRQTNLRWETRFSDLFCDDASQLPKLVIMRTYTQFQAVPSVGAQRPMMFLQHPAIDNSPIPTVDDALIFCPACNTLRVWSSTNVTPAPTAADEDGDPTWFPSMRQPVYIRATSGTDPSGNPIYATSEYLCIEMRVNVMATAGEPNGVIAMRVYFRDGTVIERACAWNWDATWTVDTNYIETVEQFGGGYYNNANSGATDLHSKVGRRITIATNYQPTVGRAWLGPPTGFVTG